MALLLGAFYQNMQLTEFALLVPFPSIKALCNKMILPKHYATKNEWIVYIKNA